MEPARLLATDLACRRGERLLFRGLSFELNAGEALQVVGPNGTGKSSLIRILAGLLRPAAGTVEKNRQTALLDERLPLDADLPLGHAFDFWSRIDGLSYGLGRGLTLNPPRIGDHAKHGGGAQVASAAPTDSAPPPPSGWSPSPGGGGLGLEDLAEVPVRFLSTGQRKRAAILMSNARNAGLWLLDEPLNGLDTQAAAGFQAQVAAYLARGGMAVIASHQPFEVPALRRLALADYAA